MAHRYGLPIQEVRCQQDGAPSSFLWRGERYRVQRVLSIWRLRTGWWDPQREADRTYYRVLAPDQQVFELYHETLRDHWVLDCVLD